MQTRRQLERAKAQAQEGSQDSITGGMDVSDLNTAMVNNLSAATPTSSGLKVSAAVVPVKRKRPITPKSPATPSSSSKLKKVEVPHAARLPRIVLVLDTQHQWWPGKITPYPPKDNRVTVARFGNIRPKSITVDCCESNIIPFEDRRKELHQLSEKLANTEAFELALRQANEAQVKDDDGLPSMDDIMSQLSSSPVASSSNSTTVKDTPKKTTKIDAIFTSDANLAIPGELILAVSDRSYYPGRIISFNNKTNKYKIEFASGHSASIERKKFYTRYERGFQTCPLGELQAPSIANYKDDVLEAQVVELYPELYEIVAGTRDGAGRLEAFLQGGKAKLGLAQRAGAGSFAPHEYGLISAMLQSEFLPDLRTSTKRSPVSNIDAESSMKRKGDVTCGFSDQKRIHFVTDVLLPEAITRLTMTRRNLGYAEAEQSIMDGTRDESTDTWWVDDIMAARDLFSGGRAR